KDVYFIPGEHDASLDKGAAYKEFFGETHFAFKHKGINFVALDNVSDPKAFIGDEQLKWLDGELAKIKKNEPIVVFAHRPLFDLYPQWDWATADGTEVTNRLAKFDHVVVFYGHIHQENHQTIGNITHHAATSLIFPLIAPGSGPKRMPIAWDKDAPFKGLGWRNVDADPKSAEYQLVQNPVKA
ncbi:MAG TPA: metallophosphoesterase, partial [Stellaceae bacterium]|nr:metallophosphoesterase [Stellaceae bacterium]